MPASQITVVPSTATTDGITIDTNANGQLQIKDGGVGAPQLTGLYTDAGENIIFSSDAEKTINNSTATNANLNFLLIDFGTQRTQEIKIELDVKQNGATSESYVRAVASNNTNPTASSGAVMLQGYGNTYVNTGTTTITLTAQRYIVINIRVQGGKDTWIKNLRIIGGATPTANTASNIDPTVSNLA